MTSNNEAIKILNRCIESLDEKIWRDIKRVTNYADKTAKRADMLNKIDALNDVEKELKILINQYGRDT